MANRELKREYLLHLADNALILGQRNAEWCGLGPVLEEDMAMANNSLDHIGQARLLYQYVAELDGDGSTEDTYAYFRGEQQFRNYVLNELPHHEQISSYASKDKDYSFTIVRNFLYSALMVLLWNELRSSNDERLAAIADKSLKEAQYHLRHARNWLIRFGDGTELSHQKAQNALDHLYGYTQEFWSDSEIERFAEESGLGVHPSRVKEEWEKLVSEVVEEATLTLPELPEKGYVTQGKEQIHSEAMGPLLAEMQYITRMHPDGNW